MPTAAAIGGAAVLGAVTSNKSSKRAAEAQTQATDQAVRAQQQATAEARREIDKIAPVAQQNLLTGAQAAADVFGQSLPAQTDVFQQGNVGAQQAILAGLPQMQNAILGNQVDLSGFQPFQVQSPDLSFFQQQMPNFIDPLNNPATQTVMPGPGANVGVGQQFSQGAFSPFGGGSNALKLFR